MGGNSRTGFPSSPFSPGLPAHPDGPTLPVDPGIPFNPLAPGIPGRPGIPGKPVSPTGPFSPVEKQEILSLSLFDKWENEGTGRLGNLPEVIYLSTKCWRWNSKEVFWVQSPWSGPLGRVSSCYPSAPHHHCPISVPLVWGYFDAVLGRTLSSFSELSLKGTVSFGSKSIRL